MTELEKLIQQRDELNQKIQELQICRESYKDIRISRDSTRSENWVLEIQKPLCRNGLYVEAEGYVRVYQHPDKANVIEHMLDLSIQLKEFADKLLVGE